MISIALETHPSLKAVAFVTRFPVPLASMPSAPLLPRLARDATAPLRSDDSVRAAIRDVLRHGGYKPTGRGKPASEYLLRAVDEGSLGSINAAVDACNVVSLHSGVPISVVDADRVRHPLAIRIAPSESSYVFNASGQTMDLSGLVCLFDAEGPCANAVKDSQRTKTSPGTTTTLSLLWGAKSLDDWTERAYAFYRELLASIGATTEEVALETR
jgi:DNA/RNA-binding domain of Phe-tRNA-synthetase-like protein